MSEKKRSFFKRAIRYTITSDDHCLCKFSKSKDEELLTATFENISATGLAFITDREVAPDFGQTVRLYFTVPNIDKKLQWIGKVVRISEYHAMKWWQKNAQKEDHVIVAVIFLNFPEEQKKAIDDAIKKQIILVGKRRRKEKIDSILKVINRYKWQFIGVTSLIILSYLFLYEASRPSENYDAKRGAPWGRRFKSLIWEKPAKKKPRPAFSDDFE